MQDKVSVRDLKESDISKILDYWHRSPNNFLENMGVDLNKMPSEFEMKKILLEKFQNITKDKSFKSTVLIITYEDQAVGVHSLFPIEVGEHAVFHAHIFDENFRGKGIAQISYMKACKIFIERFSFKRILFKTPVRNIGAIKVKEKLGIRCIGEEEINFGFIKEGTKAKVFELRREDLQS